MKGSLCFFVMTAFTLILQASPDPNIQEEVRRGEYLARAADCFACHTIPGKKPYSGGRRLRTPFGDLLTPNLTPDPETGLGLWSQDDFYRALHWGIGKNGEHLFPAFPYDHYTLMPRSDVDALYAYFRTLEPVKNRIEVNLLPFPFNVRLGLWFWKLLFFRPGEFQPLAGQSEGWNRGAYLVEGPGHCGSCHSPRNFLGGTIQSRAYTGSPIENWFAPNITSDLIAGIGDWSVDELVEFFRTGSTREKVAALGPMREVQESLSGLSDSDLRAIAVYLKSLPPRPDLDPLANAKVLSEEKQQRVLFLENCAGCHHPFGIGRMGRVPALAGNSLLRGSPANILNVVLFGLPPRGEMEGMPAFADRLEDHEIAKVINYVRARWGGEVSDPVTTEQVRDWRERYSED